MCPNSTLALKHSLYSHILPKVYAIWAHTPLGNSNHFETEVLLQAREWYYSSCEGTLQAQEILLALTLLRVLQASNIFEPPPVKESDHESTKHLETGTGPPLHVSIMISFGQPRLAFVEHPALQLSTVKLN